MSVAATPDPDTSSADGGTAVPVDLSDDAVAALAESIADTAPAEGEPAPKEDKPAEAPKEGEPPPAEGDKPKDEPEQAAKPPMPEEIRLRKLGAKLAKRHADLQLREQTIETVKQKAQAIDRLGELLAKDKLEALKAIGIEPDEIVDLVLARGTGEKKETADERVTRIEKQLADERAARAGAEQQTKVQAVFAQFRTDTVAKLKAATDLDLVNSYEAYDDIIDNMAAYHAKHGVVPDAVEVARYWEKAKEEELTSRLAKSKNFAISDRRTVTTPQMPTSTAKPKAAPSPSLTDQISDTPVGEDDLPDDPDQRLRVLMARMEM